MTPPAPLIAVPSLPLVPAFRASLALLVAFAIASLAAPSLARAQNRFGDTPTAPPAQGGGARPQGSGGGTNGQGGGGLGALGGPGGIADPQGRASQSAAGGAPTGGGAGPQGAQGPQGAGGVDLARLEAHERQDHGVPPTSQLHRGPMHGGTPTSIPGGQVITTRGLVELVRAAAGPGGGVSPGKAPRVLFFDVLGGAERLPNALAAVPAHQAGSFDDAVQREFGAFLQQVTQGRPDAALVFYCASTQCWMSYNAALRATRLGYRQVLWYRGGIEAWKAAGLPVQGAGAAQAGGVAPRR